MLQNTTRPCTDELPRQTSFKPDPSYENKTSVSPAASMLPTNSPYGSMHAHFCTLVSLSQIPGCSQSQVSPPTAWNFTVETCLSHGKRLWAAGVARSCQDYTTPCNHRLAQAQRVVPELPAKPLGGVEASAVDDVLEALSSAACELLDKNRPVSYCYLCAD